MEQIIKWYTARGYYDVNIQMTSFMPLKNCVLLRTYVPLTGIVRFNGLEKGMIFGQKLDFELPIF